MIPHGYLIHHGIIGQKWGIRRFQNKDGSLTSAGKKRYGEETKNEVEQLKPKQVHESPGLKIYTTGGYKLKIGDDKFDIEDEIFEYRNPKTKIVADSHEIQSVTDKDGTFYSLPETFNGKKYTLEELKPILTDAAKNKKTLHESAINNVLTSETMLHDLDLDWGITKEDIRKLKVETVDCMDTKGNGFVSLYYDKNDKLGGHNLEMEMYNWKVKHGSWISMNG